MSNKKQIITWTNYQRDLSKSFKSLLTTQELTDVTLSCDEKKILAHRFLLAASSPFFEEIFAENPCEHPVIVFKNVRYDDLFNVILYIYQGCVSIDAKNVERFLQAAELLDVPINEGGKAGRSKASASGAGAAAQSNEHFVVLRSNAEEDNESDDSYFEGIFGDDDARSNGQRNEQKLPTIQLKNIRSKEIVVDNNAQRLKTKKTKKFTKEEIKYDKFREKANERVNKYAMYPEEHQLKGKPTKPKLDFLQSPSTSMVQEVETSTFLTQIQKINEAGSNNSLSATTSQNSGVPSRRNSQPSIQQSDNALSRMSARRRRERKFREMEGRSSGNDYDARGTQGQGESNNSGGRRRRSPRNPKPGNEQTEGAVGEASGRRRPRRERKRGKAKAAGGNKENVGDNKNPDPDAEKYNFYR